MYLDELRGSALGQIHLVRVMSTIKGEVVAKLCDNVRLWGSFAYMKVCGEVY